MKFSPLKTTTPKDVQVPENVRKEAALMAHFCQKCGAPTKIEVSLGHYSVVCSKYEAYEGHTYKWIKEEEPHYDPMTGAKL